MSYSSKYPSSKVQAIAVLFILLITIINYLDRSAISYAIIPLENEFHLGNRDFGLIVGAFGIGYLGICFFAGLLIDRWGAVKIWCCCTVIWSLATLLMSLAQGFWSLLFLRLILGLAEAAHFPALLRVMTHWLEPQWRARCISIGLLGVPVASIIGAPFISYLIEAFNWRLMFVVLGLLGLLWSIFWIWIFRGKEPQALLQEKVSYLQFFKNPLFIGNCFNFFIFGYTVFFALMWLPGYIQQTFALDLIKTSGIALFPWISSAFFVVLGGVISDALWKKTESTRIARVYPIAFGMALSGLSFFAISFSDQLSFDILFLSLGLGFAFFVNAPLYSLNADLFKENVATAQGIMTGFFALAGIVSPSLTGWLTQSTGNFKSAILLVSLLSLLAFFIALFLQRVRAKDA